LKISTDKVIRIVLSCMVLILGSIACGGTPTPSEADIYIATREAQKIERHNYFNCTSAIRDQVSILEESAKACSFDYDCRGKIAQQIQELGHRLESTCTPVPPSESSDFYCQIRLIQAQASYVHGAPNESGASQVFAEDALANQVQEAYEYCFSLLPEPNP
jgi:hypothetical protein